MAAFAIRYAAERPRQLLSGPPDEFKYRALVNRGRPRGVPRNEAPSPLTRSPSSSTHWFVKGSAVEAGTH
jgi:hypothetical protein